MKINDVGLNFIVFVSVASFIFCISILFVANGNLNTYVGFLLLSGIVSLLSIGLLTLKSI